MTGEGALTTYWLRQISRKAILEKMAKRKISASQE
jgi:hypothetical protein